MKRTIEVAWRRYFRHGRPRWSEFLDAFSDNLPGFIPGRLVRPAYEFLERIVERLLWI